MAIKKSELYSTILVCSAPANAFKDWNSAFEQIRSGFEFQDWSAH
jgi:hypothetical protein